MNPTFAELGVPSDICASLAARGIVDAFEIQAATIADSLAGRDVCGRAPTGSGKTLAFGIPLVATVGTGDRGRPRGLVLAPTRELAEQITTELASFAGDVRVGVVYGGVGYGPQRNALRRGLDVLVACPGRLEDLISQGDVDLSMVDRVVIDEADRMADMGFLPAVRRLLDATAAKRQTVLFSATLDGDIAKLTAEYQRNPVRHEVGESTPDITAADHLFWKVDRTSRPDAAADVVKAAWPAVVFCRTRHGADRLARQLQQRGVDAAPIHGGRSQGQRTRALESFTNGKAMALVATDVAARGIHVDGVASVVHFDPPEDHKAYVHRSGRTARAGHRGLVVSLVQKEQISDVRKIQSRIGLDVRIVDPDVAAMRELAIEHGDAAPPRPKVLPAERREIDDARGAAAGGSRAADERSRKGGRRRGGPRRSGKSQTSGSDRAGSAEPAIPTNRSGGGGATGPKPQGSRRGRGGGGRRSGGRGRSGAGSGNRNP